MKMDLIQPFIGSLDAVLAEMMQAPATIADLTMEEDGYRKKGLAAVVTFKGQIEGRIVLDMEPPAAAKVASFLAGHGSGSRGADRPRSGLRACQHGDRQRRHPAQRSRLPVQSVSTVLASRGTLRKSRTGFGSDNPLLRDHQRKSVLEHRNALPRAPFSRANACCRGLTKEKSPPTKLRTDALVHRARWPIRRYSVPWRNNPAFGICSE